MPLFHWYDGDHSSAAASASCLHGLWRWTSACTAENSCREARDSVSRLHVCKTTDSAPSEVCAWCPSRCPHPMLGYPSLLEETTTAASMPLMNHSAVSTFLTGGLDYGHSDAVIAASGVYATRARSRRRCIVGDSHSRTLHNELARLRGFRCDLREQQRTHGVCTTPGDVYVPLSFPTAAAVDVAMKLLELFPPLRASNSNASFKVHAAPHQSRCDDILVNVGQWPSSFRVLAMRSFRKSWVPPYVANLSDGALQQVSAPLWHCAQQVSSPPLSMPHWAACAHTRILPVVCPYSHDAYHMPISPLESSLHTCTLILPTLTRTAYKCAMVRPSSIH